jgi:hypothetical protein
MVVKIRLGVSALREKINDRFSHAAQGLILMFAAIPIIVVIKYNYDDNILLGAVVSIMLAFGAIELNKKDDTEEGEKERY